jgi:predicted SprT family Zn-dependent metalloprotease
MNFDFIFESLQTKMVLQLNREYDQICYQYNIKLLKPLIIVKDLKSSWGQWDNEQKVLSLSSKLIKEYSWDIVIQVLKHEMAHQIAAEIYGTSDHHGKGFLKACESIAVFPEFCKASLNIESNITHWKESFLKTEESFISRRIERLLNLAQSGNEHEAILAMEKVHELYSKYHIDKIIGKQQLEYRCLTIKLNKKRVPNTYLQISAILQRYYFVNVIYSELYEPLCDECHKTIELIGSKHNLLMAEHVFYFLQERMESLWIQYRSQKSVSGKFKLSFQRGLITGFQNKLENLSQSKNSDINKLDNISNHLILLENQKLNHFTNHIFPKQNQKNCNSNKVYTEHYNYGKVEGKKLNVTKPLKSSKSEKNILKFLT